jgi:hypothetical protein
MIVCDDHFLNNKSMLKTMLRVFEKRIIQIFRLRSISWIVFFLSFRRKARDVCICVCVCVFVCVFERKMRVKNVVCEKNLFSVESKDFCFLKSILELIICSFVNIKRREEEFTSLTKFKSSSLRLRFVTSYKSSFYSLYSFRF